jgi:putative spermidine/putrescine transport system permease protein
MSGSILLLLPCILILLGFFVVPYVNMVTMSFRVPSTSKPYEVGFTLANYIKALTDTYYLGVLWDTVWFGVLTTVVCLLLGYPVAYHLARTKFRYKGLLYAGVLSPLLVGVVIRTYSWMIILADGGLINDALHKLGLISHPVRLMYNYFGVSVGLVHVFLPFMVLPILGTIQGIDPALDNAARSLGASKMRTFFRIVLPLSLPGIQSGTILVFLLTISSYIIPILLGGLKVMIMPTLVVQQVLGAFLWPFGAALALIMTAVAVVILYLYVSVTSRMMKGLA